MKKRMWERSIAWNNNREFSELMLRYANYAFARLRICWTCKNTSNAVIAAAEWILSDNEISPKKPHGTRYVRNFHGGIIIRSILCSLNHGETLFSRAGNMIINMASRKSTRYCGQRTRNDRQRCRHSVIWRCDELASFISATLRHRNAWIRKFHQCVIRNEGSNIRRVPIGCFSRRWSAAARQRTWNEASFACNFGKQSIGKIRW